MKSILTLAALLSVAVTPAVAHDGSKSSMKTSETTMEESSTVTGSSSPSGDSAATANSSDSTTAVGGTSESASESSTGATSGSGSESGSATASMPKHTMKKDKTAMSAPDGFLLIEEQIAVDMKDAPLTFMNDAVDQFNSNNRVEAASNLRAAAKLLRIQNQGKGLDSDIGFATAADNLETIAKDLKDQKIADEKTFKSRLAQVAYHKAAHHRLLASREWSNKSLKNAGHDMEASLNAIETGSKWADQEMAKGAEKSVEQVRTVADKLADGSSLPSTEVSKALDNLNSAVSSFGTKIDGSKARAAEDTEESM